MDRRILCILIIAFATLSIVACDDNKTMQEHAQEAQAKNAKAGTFSDTTSGSPSTSGTVVTGGSSADQPVQQQQQQQQPNIPKSCDIPKPATQDDLEVLAESRANGLPNVVKVASDELAKDVRDVSISIDPASGHSVKVQVIYDFQMGKATIDLRGQMDNSPNTKLVQAPKPGQKETFSGLMTCADSSCRNIFLRVDQLQGKKVAKSLYIIQRWSEAHVVLNDQDRKAFAKMPNQNESAFAEYISNSLNNICLLNLKAVSDPKNNAPACLLQTLKAECGTEDMRQPSAKAMGLRTWEVAGGRGGFELQFLDSGFFNPLSDSGAKPFFSVRGPLTSATVSTPSPQWKHPLVFSGNAKGIDSVNLVTNETSVSDLKLELNFTGSPAAKLAVTVSSILPSSTSSAAILQTAQGLPVLQQQDLVSDSEIVGGSEQN